MKNPHISIVIPVFNEKESLRELVNQIRSSMQKTGESFEFVCIDDGSTDGSFDELLILKKGYKENFTIIRFRKNLGKSAALAAGFTYSRGKIIVTLDADLQDDPDEIPKLINKLNRGYDLVVGWRKHRVDHGGKIRLSRIFNSVVARLGRVSLHDMNCGLKVMRRQVALDLDLYGELHRFIPVLVSSGGFKVTEEPVVHHGRKYGYSKFGTGRIFRASFDLVTTLFLTSFKTRPLHIFGPIGVFFAVAGIIPLMYLTYLRMLGESIGRRPLLLMGILFVLFGVQLFSTGLLGELLTSSQARKQSFPIDEIIT